MMIFKTHGGIYEDVTSSFKRNFFPCANKWSLKVENIYKQNYKMYGIIKKKLKT